MFRKLFLSLLIIVLATTANSQDKIYIDSIVGLDPETGGLAAEIPIEFVFNYRIVAGKLTGCTNAKRVYSPDGATWQPLNQIPNPIMPGLLDLAFFGNSKFSVTGTGADTIGFGGAALSGGVPQGYDGWAKTIHTMVFSEDIGKTLCIDSAFYPPSGTWLWTSDAGSVVPEWDGPFCYEIVDCCTGIRGDFNYDGGIDITDLTDFINWFHKGGDAAVCTEEGNVDGNFDGGLPSSISDLTYYVNYLFKGGAAPVACP